MDKELFRLILLGCGVALVAAVYYWDRLRGLFTRRPAAPARVARDAPRVEDLPDDGFDISPPRVVSREAASDDEPPDILASELEALIRAEEPADVLLDETSAEGAPTDVPVKPVEPPPVLALTLVSSSGSISGIRLRRVLTDHGLGLGRRGLFERIGEEGRPLYSAANLVEPGLFDPVSLDGMSTPGLVLFQVLDGDGDHLQVFDTMLETARRLADRLDCALCDTRRQPLGKRALEALRETAARAGDGA